MRNVAHLQHLAQQLRNLHRCGTYQYWAACITCLLDFVDNGTILLAGCLVYSVIQVLTENRTVGRNLNYIQFVDVPELTCLCAGSTGHTGELVVHTEVVLKSDGCEGLGSSLHLYMLLSFNSLVQAIAPAATFHDTTSLLVNDLHLTVHDYILVVLIKHGVSLQQLLQGVNTLALYAIVCQILILLVEASLVVQVCTCFQFTQL